jgi:hypothetical protein
MSQDKDAQEPSMEEILSSIRRIIAEEDKERDAPGEPPATAAAAPAVAAATPEPAAPDATEEEDVLELTEIAEDEPEPAAIEGEVAVLSTTPATADDASTKETDVDTTPAGDELVSGTAAAASTSALAKLTRAAGPEQRKAPAVGRSMDDFLTDMLRPMLKEWLDQHLSEIVERIVEEEVKKLARRAELM